MKMGCNGIVCCPLREWMWSARCHDADPCSSPSPQLLREQMAKANQRKSKKRKVEQGEEGKGNKGEDGEGGEKAGGAGEGEGEGAEGGLEPEPTFASKGAEAGWLVVNPLGVPTEREVYTSQTGAFGGTAHRILIVKKRE